MYPDARFAIVSAGRLVGGSAGLGRSCVIRGARPSASLLPSLVPCYSHRRGFKLAWSTAWRGPPSYEGSRATCASVLG